MKQEKTEIRILNSIRKKSLDSEEMIECFNIFGDIFLRHEEISKELDKKLSEGEVKNPLILCNTNR